VIQNPGFLPHHPQNWIICSLSYALLTLKISEWFVHNFLGYLVHTHTHTQTNKNRLKHNLLGGGNNNNCILLRFVVMTDRLRKLVEDLHLPSSGGNRILPGNDKFRRNDRVIIRADPDHFKRMQTERYGGWSDEMALVRLAVHRIWKKQATFLNSSAKHWQILRIFVTLLRKETWRKWLQLQFCPPCGMRYPVWIHCCTPPKYKAV